MALLPDGDVVCIISEGPPIDQIVESTSDTGSTHHTFYYRMNDEPLGTVRILNVLYYKSVTPQRSLNGVMATVVTANHNSVFIMYGRGGHGSFTASRELIESRRL